MATSAEPLTYRPFRVADGMVLIAALFVAAAWDRGAVLEAVGWRFMVPPTLGVLANQAVAIVTVLLPFLVVASPTLLALRLQTPRPGLRALLEQPGAVACALASLAVIPVVLLVLVSNFTAGRPMAAAWTRAVDDLKPERFALVGTLIGLAVLVAWIVLRARQQWHPEASWIDRLGRLVGSGWIVMILGGVLPLVLLLLRLAGVAI
jgi:hypothetical protein